MMAGHVPVPAGEERTVPARFADVARRHPDRPAVLAAGAALTYRQLAAAAAGVAGAVLRAAGPGEGRVGLLLDHGHLPVVAMLGVLAAGKTYVPLDPGYPADRLRYMASHAAADLLLTTAAHRELAGSLGAAVLDLSTVPPAPAGGLPESLATPDSPAYILFTSGSTGRPKGVVQNHRNVLFAAANHIDNLRLTADDRLSLVSSYSFDMAVTDLYAALLCGAASVPVDVRRHGLGALAGVLAEHRVSVYHSTPTVFRYLTDGLAGTTGRGLPDLRAVLLGGEEVTAADLARCRRHASTDCVFINGYGATEVSFAVQHHLRPGDGPTSGVVPIGRPLAGIQLDLVPSVATTEDPSGSGRRGGDPDVGEVVVRSRHVALGYWRDPERTAERFTDHGDGTRSYRTGDLARRRPDGALVYLGRSDRQVKVRGHRVELGELEAALAALPGVGQAAVTTRTSTVDGTTELIAYAVPEPGGVELDGAALRRALAETLPDYLLPAVVVVTDRFPLGPTGKVDLAALPEPPSPLVAATPAGVTAGGTARLVAEIWGEVLGAGADSVPLDRGFLELGGHSLLLARVRQRLCAELGRDVPLSRLFEYPTVTALAGYLDGVGDDEFVPVDVAVGDVPEPAVGTRDADIAVVGMAVRVPGAEDLDTFWHNLLDGVDAVRRYNEDELLAAGEPAELVADPDYVPVGGALAGLEDFDAELFGYPPAEAARLDPQHRLFLEVAWRAIEDAGYDPDRYDGTVGVFAGAAPNRYLLGHLLDGGTGDPEALFGSGPDYLPLRVSHKLGLTGPSIAVQTACSSSLAAVCLAADSLRDFRTDLVIAGGAAVTATRRAGYLAKAGGLTSPDGTCRVLDAAANGTVFGNGAGAVALKRLSDALADGDQVYAVLRGWAVTNDGAGRAGFAAPGVAGQTAVVAEALVDAEVEAGGIGYVEVHGSATPVGDAMEADALARAFDGAGAGCLLGSVKPNVSNLDAAAGVVGLVKAALAVRHGTVPATLHVDTPNPEVEQGGHFQVAVKTVPWPVPEGPVRPRRAGVSSFGLGGTNAHVVLEQPPVPPRLSTVDEPEPLLLSALTAPALRAMAARLARHLAAHPELPLADVAYTLAVGRRVLPCRLAVVAANPTAAMAALSTWDSPVAAGGTGIGDLEVLCRRWAGGGEVDWVGWFARRDGARRRVGLPGYPFERRRHWIEPRRRS